MTREEIKGVKPASDEEIAAFNGDIAIYQRDPNDRLLHCVQCDASPGHMGGHRPGCDFRTWPRIKARLEQDAELLREAEMLLKMISDQAVSWQPLTPGDISEVQTLLAKLQRGKV